MSFQRGPEPGDRPKQRVLVIDPLAVCRRLEKAGINYCEVKLTSGLVFAAGNAAMAWRRAEQALQEPTHD